MTTKEFRVPFYAQATLVMIGLFTLITILYIGRSIIVPFVFATIISILLSPAVNFLVRQKFNRLIAIAIILLLSILVIGAFSVLIFSQMSRFAESLPLLAEKFTEVLNQTITWASGYFDISTQKINAWIASTKDELINSSGSAIGKTIISLGGVFVVIFIVPVYIFMILYYQPLLLDFIHKLAGVDHQSKVSEMILQTKTLIQRYLIGLLIEVIVISFLYTIGLLILGIEYALILGILGAFLNLIPYLGSIIAAAMPMIIAFINKPSPWYVLLVLGLYIFIQFIDNNFLVPRIVGSKVKLNALASIIAVIIFGTLWGISGMLLAIPLTAIVKLIFDHIDSLKPWGFLLGDTMPTSPLLKIEPIIKKIKKII